MKTAIKNIVGSGYRDTLVLVMVSYAHSAVLTDFFFENGSGLLLFRFVQPVCGCVHDGSERYRSDAQKFEGA